MTTMKWRSTGIIFAAVLLPINSTTCGDKFNNAFSYATNFASTDIVQDNSYEAAYKAALIK